PRIWPPSLNVLCRRACCVVPLASISTPRLLHASSGLPGLETYPMLPALASRLAWPLSAPRLPTVSCPVPDSSPLACSASAPGTSIASNCKGRPSRLYFALIAPFALRSADAQKCGAPEPRHSCDNAIAPFCQRIALGCC